VTEKLGISKTERYDSFRPSVTVTSSKRLLERKISSVQGGYFTDSFDVPRTPTNILLLGSTGHIGSRIREEALNRGHEVTAVARTPVT
jgi:hypothetical protein